MGVIHYIHKVNRIQKKIGATEFFTPAEIASAIINLWDAKRELNQQEYFYVSVIYEAYQMVKKEVCLDYENFLGLCDDIIAHFDLVAPYYKYCGNNQLEIARLLDFQKDSYRREARKLLEEKQLFSEKWMTLHKEFMREFYA